jgi:1-deoxy-D-xylulose-5-phosphate reductoisomerase
MNSVTPAQALRHPNWEMGAKITIDSATLMNKGFEMIEAKWLFDISPEKIEVVVHPESIIHSAVQFEDGSVKAQLGVPDMRLPIQYAFTYPARLHLNGDRLDLFKLGAMHFEPADMERFPCLRLSYEAISMGGTAPCVLNAANEIVNLAFREGKISYPMIAEIIEKTMQAIAVIHNPTLEQLIETDKQARAFALNLVVEYGI